MKRVSVLLSALCLALGMTGMAVAAPLVVAHDTNFKPFEFKDSSGQYTGFDIELWDNVAKRAGLEYKFQPMDFNGIIPGLQTGNIDAAIAAMTITPQRQEVVDMSDPYYDTGIMLVVRTEDVDKYKSLEDLAGKVIASKTAPLRRTICGPNSPRPRKSSCFPTTTACIWKCWARARMPRSLTNPWCAISPRRRTAA